MTSVNYKDIANKIKFEGRAFIDGKYVDAIDGKKFETINPATGDVLCSVAQCNSKDVDLAVKVSRKAFKSGVWSRTSPEFRKDVLLANIMVYILTKPFNTASWIYYGRREEGGRYFPKEFKKIQTSTGIAMFPAEMSTWPPRSYLDRMFNIKQLTEMSKGGHFAALEQPDLLVNDIIKFAQTLRK